MLPCYLNGRVKYIALYHAHTFIVSRLSPVFPPGFYEWILGTHLFRLPSLNCVVLLLGFIVSLDTVCKLGHGHRPTASSTVVGSCDQWPLASEYSWRLQNQAPGSKQGTTTEWTNTTLAPILVSKWCFIGCMVHRRCSRCVWKQAVLVVSATLGVV